MRNPDEIPPLDARLPRGRNALDPDVVFAHQRRRLLLAAAEAIAEKGLAVTVADIIGRAGISRATFYKHFDDKFDCLAAAYDEAFAELSAGIRAACAAQPRWPENVEAAVESAAAFAASSPAQAALVAIDPQGCDQVFLTRVLTARRALATMLSTAAVQGARPGPDPDLAAEAMVAAVLSVISARLERSALSEIPTLAPDLASLVLAPYRGSDARRPVPAMTEN